MSIFIGIIIGLLLYVVIAFVIAMIRIHKNKKNLKVDDSSEVQNNEEIEIK